MNNINTHVNSASSATQSMQSIQSAPIKIRIWDIPTRVFHGLLILTFAGAYITGDDDHWHLWHLAFGYSFVALIVYRLFYGVVGGHFARFAQFKPSIARAWRYARGLVFNDDHETHWGHNPLGAWAIYTMLALGIVVGLCGFGAEFKWGESFFNGKIPDFLGEVHDAASNIMMALVCAHVAGVLISSWRHKINLVRSMIAGWKSGQPKDAHINQPHRFWEWPLAIVLIGGVIAMMVWVLAF